MHFEGRFVELTKTFGYMLPRLEIFVFILLSIVFSSINLLQKSLSHTLLDMVNILILKLLGLPTL